MSLTATDRTHSLERLNPFNLDQDLVEENQDQSEDEEEHEGYCLSDDHTRLVRSTSLEYPNRRQAICRFALGSLMAFVSGLTLTTNNFIIKETRINFGELIAVRSVLQMPVMLSIAFYKGHSIIPNCTNHLILTNLVGIFGALQMLCTIACVKFMPVGDAMALIFTSPLFTIIFAAVFLKHRLSFIKVSAASVLMAGIIFVTKPPFLFPEDVNHSNQTFSNEKFIDNYLMPNNIRKSFKALEWSPEGPILFQVEPDNGNTYFIGAIIALGASILSAANNIIMAKLGRGVPTSVQLLYIGCGCFLLAIGCQMLDDKDRFFTKQVLQITLTEYGICLAVSLIGISGFFCTIRSLSLVPPSTVATLRTSQVIVAFLAQVFLTGIIPGVLDVMGASLIFLAALVITFERPILKIMSKILTCCS